MAMRCLSGALKSPEGLVERGWRLQVVHEGGKPGLLLVRIGHVNAPQAAQQLPNALGGDTKPGQQASAYQPGAPNSGSAMDQDMLSSL